MSDNCENGAGRYQCDECGSSDVDRQSEMPFPADSPMRYYQCNDCGEEWT